MLRKIILTPEEIAQGIADCNLRTVKVSKAPRGELYLSNEPYYLVRDQVSGENDLKYLTITATASQPGYFLYIDNMKTWISLSQRDASFLPYLLQFMSNKFSYYIMKTQAANQEIFNTQFPTFKTQLQLPDDLLEHLTHVIADYISSFPDPELIGMYAKLVSLFSREIELRIVNPIGITIFKLDYFNLSMIQSLGNALKAISPLELSFSVSREGILGLHSQQFISEHFSLFSFLGASLTFIPS
jgi:hypothetical protein